MLFFLGNDNLVDRLGLGSSFFETIIVVSIVPQTIITDPTPSPESPTMPNGPTRSPSTTPPPSVEVEDDEEGDNDVP